MTPESEAPPDTEETPESPDEEEPSAPERDAPLPPAKEPKPHELPDIMLSKGRAKRLDRDEISKTFSEKTAEFIQTGRAGFAVRLHGSAVQRDSIDAVLFAAVLQPLARASRWVGGTVTGRRGFDPGLNAAFSGASLLVHFTRAEDEEAVRVEKERSLSPTVGAGLYLAGLSAVTTDTDQLLSGVDRLGTWGVHRYVETLDQLSENALSIDWLTKDERFVRATVGKVRHAYEVLHTPPKMIRHEVSMTGHLDAAAAASRRFRLLISKDRAVSGTYLPSAEESLDGAWNHKVIATIRVEEPEHKNLPRSPRPKYTLIKVTNISPRRRRRTPG